jgi:hypothetical protein
MWYLFWVICRELYREARGSYPEPVIMLKLKEGCGQEFEYWLKLYRSLSGRIVVLDDTCIKIERVKELFGIRLKETFSQGLGFIIVFASDVHKAEEEIRKLCSPHIPRLLSIERIPAESSMLDRLSKIVSSSFGLSIGLNELDAIVAEIDRRYRDFVNELLSSDYVAYVRRDVSAYESEDHIAMKVLTVKVLVEEYNVKSESICCTCPLDSNVIADIYIEDKGLAVECETMLEVAPTPYIKIFETVRKYLNVTKPINEIWVIIRNWPAVIRLGDLVWIENLLREEFKRNNRNNVNIRFFVPHIHRKTIHALDDIVRDVGLTRVKL